MEKRIIKAIIAERQQEISKIQLVERPISLLGMKKGQFQGMSWIYKSCRFGNGCCDIADIERC